MSGESDVTAGEYVLGVLDAAAMRAVEARAAQDPAFAAEIAFWEDNLAPLSQLVTPVTAPPVLWSRLALATGIGSEPRWTSSPRVWQGATAVALAMAAGFAFVAFLPRPPAPGAAPGTQFVAALAPSGASVPFLAEARADGAIAITRLLNTTAASGRDFELWSLPNGATQPVSLGVLSHTVLVHPVERPLADTQLLVSDEPAGGSPTGKPTGAVLFGGTLTPVSPATTPGQ